MAGIDNLRTPSTEEARERGKMGGIASAKARREKKMMKDTLETLLAMTLKEGKATNIEGVKSIASLNGKNISVQEAIMLVQIQKAMHGDTRAAEFVRDASGNKVAESVAITGSINNPFAGLTTEELKKLVNNE